MKLMNPDLISFIEIVPRGRPRGKNILVLHGWGAYKEKLEPLATQLKRHGWHVIIVDLPGFGKTPPPPGAYTVLDYAKVIDMFAKGRFDKENFIVFGHSFGGRVATKMALVDENIHGLVLCATSGLIRAPLAKRAIFITLAKLGRVFLSIPGVYFIALIWKKFIYKAAREHDYEKAQGIMRSVFRTIVGDDIKPLLPKLKIPVLLLWGEKDRQTPLKTAYTAKSLLERVLLKTFPEVGHALPYKRPAEIARQISIWDKTVM